MPIYYKYAPYGTKIVVLSYGDGCVYWSRSEYLVKFFVDDLGNRFNVKLLGYAHWFMSIRLYHIQDHSISVDQARYDTSIVDKYLDTATFKTSKKFYNNTFPYDMIFTKADTSTSDDQVEKLTREFNIH